MEELAAKILNFMSSLRPYSQVGMGAVSGLLTGFLLMEIGKFTAIVIGGGMILIKIAEIEGFIHIDWLKVKQNVQDFSIKPANNFTLGNIREQSSNVQNFIVSFIGGSLIGIGCS